MKRRVETKKAKRLKTRVRDSLLKLMWENDISQAARQLRLRINSVCVKQLLELGRNLTLDLLTRVVEALEGDISSRITNKRTFVHSQQSYAVSERLET